MDKRDFALKKAELILSNKIFIDRNIKLIHPLSKSSAGPSSGSLSIAFSFNNCNIKMSVSSSEKQKFQLIQKQGQYNILKNNNVFLENIQILPILFHAPGQAFLNIDNKCIYNCAFCHLENENYLSEYNDNKYINLILQASLRKDFQAIALTSGIYPNNSDINKRFCNIINNVRNKLPETPIGVETCIKDSNDISLIKESGVDEIKINLQIPDEKLFKKICPNFTYKDILSHLNKAVEVFGRGKVASNVLLGYGESNESLISSIEQLSEIGVVPTLRKIRINNSNKSKLKKASIKNISKITATDILEISMMHKKILEKNNLTTKSFYTMCHKCGCCDIVPFWDI
jgi:molybdenum cofactor biosynthesis enzyme MoaA